MNRFIVLLLLIPFNVSAFNADTSNTKSASDSLKYWNFKSLSVLSISQTAFVNWAAGGESSLSGKGEFAYEVDYQKGKFTFDQNGDFVFGLVGYVDKRIEKTNDKLNLSMSLNHRTSKKWSLSNMTTLKTQFANGYKYPDDSTLISGFFAPAYLTISLGFYYKPNKDFQIFMSPVSGKMTFVCIDELANKGLYGVKPAEYDTAGNLIKPGSHFVGQVGLNLFTRYKSEIMKNIKLNTALTLQNNYLDFDIRNRWNIDVDFDTRIIFDINDIFATILYVHLKYDHNAKFPNYEMIDGEEVVVSESPKIQINESFGLGLKYQIN
jgi:hypothetical protein